MKTLNINRLIIPILLVCSIIVMAFNKIERSTSKKETNISNQENWYLCGNCCKTKKSTSAPWESGCRQNSSGMHNYQFCLKAGDVNYTCRNCDAEVYGDKESASPAASHCCGGGTHSWYNK